MSVDKGEGPGFSFRLGGGLQIWPELSTGKGWVAQRLLASPEALRAPGAVTDLGTVLGQGLKDAQEAG